MSIGHDRDDVWKGIASNQEKKNDIFDSPQNKKENKLKEILAIWEIPRTTILDWAFLL